MDTQDEIKPGVYYTPLTAASALADARVRLVRPNLRRRGALEVYEFDEKDLPAEMWTQIEAEGGWLDFQWQELVWTCRARKYPQERDGRGELSWEGWRRLGSRYVVPRPCAECRVPFRDTRGGRELCPDCIEREVEAILGRLTEIGSQVFGEAGGARGVWKSLGEIRERVRFADETQIYSRRQVWRLKRAIQPIASHLVKTRKEAQETYAATVNDLRTRAQEVRDRSLASPGVDRAVLDRLKQIHREIRQTDREPIGRKDLAAIMDILGEASANEARKIEESRAEDERRREGARQYERTLREHLAAAGEDREALRRILDEVRSGEGAGLLEPRVAKGIADRAKLILDALDHRERNQRRISEGLDSGRGGREILREIKNEVKLVNLGLTHSPENLETLEALKARISLMVEKALVTADDAKRLLGDIEGKIAMETRLRAVLR